MTDSNPSKDVAPVSVFPKKPKRNKYALGCTVLASMSSILLGYDIGVMSGASIYIQKDMKLSDTKIEVLTGILNVYSLIGSCAAGRTSDWLGRKLTIVFAAVIFFVGALMMGFATNYAFLMAGRFVAGVGVGYALMIAPVYTAEVSPASTRGFLTSFPEVFINAGIMFGYVSNYAFSHFSLHLGWRLMLGIGAIPSVFLGFGVLAMPESPRWLIMQGRLGDAMKVLNKTSDSPEEAQLRLAEIKEAAGIPENCTEDVVPVPKRNKGQGVWKELLLRPTPAVRRILIAGVGIHFFQQSSGIDAVVLYENERKLVSLSENMKEKEEEEEVGEMGFQSEEEASGVREENVKSASFLKLPSEGSDGKAENRLQYKHFYQTPADLIIPISKGGNSTGPWFVIQNGSDFHSKEIKIPNNTYKAVLEIYVSSHASDEFWYSNPPNTIPQNNRLTVAPVTSAFRQVFATIDGLYVGSFVPFPIVYSGGIDPSFWDPIVAIGAFYLPSDDLDLTPFLGLLLDNESHTFSLGITGATSFWLVDANLHLWLDHNSSHVTAGLVRYTAPEIEITRKNRVESSESKFKIQAKRKLKFEGWVMSSQGNLTTEIEHELEYENEIKTKAESGFKEVQLKSKTKTEIEVQSASPRSSVAKVSYETEYPLELKIERERKGDHSYVTRIEFSHEKEEKGKVELPSGEFSTSLKNRQESESRTLVQGQEVLSSGANTEQKYKFRDQNGCYIRNVVAGAGYLLEDSSSNVCLQ